MKSCLFSILVLTLAFVIALPATAEFKRYTADEFLSGTHKVVSEPEYLNVKHFKWVAVDNNLCLFFYWENINTGDVVSALIPRPLVTLKENHKAKYPTVKFAWYGTVKDKSYHPGNWQFDLMYVVIEGKRKDIMIYP